MRVEPATTADLPALVARWEELMDHHRALDPVLYAQVPQAAQHYRAHLRRHIDDSRSLVLVAPEGDRRGAGDLLGYLVASQGMRAPHYVVREVAMIHDLAVRPDVRGQGIGRALVAAAFERFRRRGLQYVQVSYAPGNPEAARFWPHLGFSPLLHEAYRRL